MKKQSTTMMITMSLLGLSPLWLAGCSDSHSESEKAVYYQDADLDGFGSADSTMEFKVEKGMTLSNGRVVFLDDENNVYADNSGDCNDSNNFVNPNAPEISGDDVDNNCDGVAEEGSGGDNDIVVEEDADHDGFSSTGGDCNDADASIYPGASETDNDHIDSNCNGIDNNPTTPTPVVDGDGDGYEQSTDCNDADLSVHPGAMETDNDGIDSNCDGVDNNPSTPPIVDDDNPPPGSKGEAGSAVRDSDGDGYTYFDGDCDLTDKEIFPGATELCDDAKDNDCDGTVDETGCEEPASGPVTLVNEGSLPGMTLISESKCEDGTDNDLDGKADCADSDCASTTTCNEETDPNIFEDHEGQFTTVKEVISATAQAVEALIEFTFGTATTAGEIVDMQELLNDIKAANNSANDAETVIKNYFNAITDTGKDDQASLFVLYVGIYGPDIAKALFTDDSLNAYLKDTINDGGAFAFGSAGWVITTAILEPFFAANPAYTTLQVTLEKLFFHGTSDIILDIYD